VFACVVELLMRHCWGCSLYLLLQVCLFNSVWPLHIHSSKYACLTLGGLCTYSPQSMLVYSGRPLRIHSSTYACLLWAASAHTLLNVCLFNSGHPVNTVCCKCLTLGSGQPLHIRSSSMHAMNAEQGLQRLLHL